MNRVQYNQKHSDKKEVVFTKVGHDTPHHKASTEVYDKLPGCCKYDRTAK